MIGNTFGFQKGHIPWNKNEKGCVTKKRKGVPYFCDNCGKKIMRIPWQIKFGWGKFCSLICKQQSKELKNRISRLAKLRWQDPEFFKKSFKAFSRRPTSLEKQMMEIIRKYNLPYKYTGDGSFLIGWKNPDFVNTNSEKKVIEVGNIYHHPYPYAENRAKHYAKYGWASYIFIQDKLNEEEIINKLAI